MSSFKFNKAQKETRKWIIDVSYKARFAHLGSCLSAVDLIDAIYQVKRKEEHFVLSAGHAGIALYAVLAKNHILDPSVIYKLHIHPDRNVNIGIDVSTGSLGQGLPIALGMALADKNKRVFCIITDGECAEGSIWESLKVISENRVTNLVIIVNANGWGACDPISLPTLVKRIRGFGLNIIKVYGHDFNKISSAIESATNKGPSVIFAKTNVEQFPFLKGQGAHYYVMNEEDYVFAMETLR